MPAQAGNQYVLISELTPFGKRAERAGIMRRAEMEESFAAGSNTRTPRDQFSFFSRSWIIFHFLLRNIALVFVCDG
jgi:hypothetical protein